ncbi:phasin family protein [Roseospira visakhapatnamensis]|uniref:Phasin family protein n=1 Tax=Roseospira visakhapatnamensis TaxID=390880 RepID=A0A7W6WAR4_9PROT|nr:phasin family protein [Roseospira visakhapatnamensis]MBB4266781.1 phasin family protein [Roseospira visakhapatnamensis]
MAKPETFFDMDFTKYLADLKVPGLDLDAILESQKKNVEALTHANKLAFEGMQAVMQRQAELLRQSMEEYAKSAQSFGDMKDPQDAMARHTEMAKQAFERMISNMREMSELMAKSNNEVFELLNKRFSETLEEMKKMMEKAEAAPKARKTAAS